MSFSVPIYSEQPVTTQFPTTFASPAHAAGNSSRTNGDASPACAPLDARAARGCKPLRILFIASEGVPYIKTGGLADVIGALPRALRKLGHDVRIVLPRYKAIDIERWHLTPVVTGLRVPMDQGVEPVTIFAGPADPELEIPVYFVDNDHYFQREKLYGYNDDGERFILFCRAALEFTRYLDWSPGVIHCHDWHTAIVPNWMKTLYLNDPHFAQTATVYTIHNLAYQGIFGYRILEIAGVAEEGFIYSEVPALANVVDLMGRGIHFADVVSTVSPSYAREILTPEFGERLDPILRERKDRLYGILNGIDTDEYDPATDHFVPAQFDAFALERRQPNKRALQEHMNLPVDDRIPLLGIISRLSDQKGFDLLDQVAVPLIEQGVQLVVSGTGDQHYHSMFQRLAARYPTQVAIQLTFNVELSQRIYAGADMLLMPSRFEPCGLTQMLAMRYGCIPVVHRTGGLADTVQEFDPVQNTGNGFCFTRYDPFHLFAAVVRALEVYKQPPVWRELMQRAMLSDYSWDASAEQYVALYLRARELRAIASERVTQG